MAFRAYRHAQANTKAIDLTAAMRLIYILFAKRAILDGWAGISYAHMLATYEGLIDVYLKLLSRGIDVDQGI